MRNNNEATTDIPEASPVQEDDYTVTDANARIAGLELVIATTQPRLIPGELLSEVFDKMKARIAELENKIATYEADLADPTLSVGEAYAYRSEDHGKGKKP